MPSSSTAMPTSRSAGAATPRARPGAWTEGGAAEPRRAAAPAEQGVRPEIQALRAGAVLLVVLFHFWPGRVPGGYIGVDVFFVISGFLITGHLLREVDRTGTVRLREFWARRARRLLPAAYLVLAVSAAATLIWVPSSLWLQWGKEMVGATLYVENWVLAADAVDYLAAENDPSAAQHYWTLSAEEQFYLIWPLLILGATVVATRVARLAPHRRTVITGVLVTATLASLVFSLYLTVANPSAAYFVTPTRAWQFGAGALLALWETRARRGDVVVPQAVRSIVSWLGVATLIGLGLVYDASTPFPGTAALGPVLATVAVVWAGAPTSRLGPTAVMSLRPVRFLGDVSYSLYLWHWPPLVLLPFVLDDDLGLLQRSVLLVLVVVLSAATKKLVEDPVRFTRRWGLRRPVVTLRWTALAAAVVVLIAGSGWYVSARQEAADRAEAARLAADAPPCFGAASMDPERECENPDLDTMLVPSPDTVGGDYADYPECWIDGDVDTFKECTFGPVDDPDVPQVALVGDSHARAMLPAFIRLAEEGKIGLHPQLKATCAWTSGSMDFDDPLRGRTCESWKTRLQPWLIENSDRIDVVVTTGYTKVISGSSASERNEQMAAAWRPVAERGVTIVGLKDNPWHATSPSKCLAELTTVEPDSCSITRTKAFRYHDPFEGATQLVPGTLTLDLTDYYCHETICPSWIGGVNVYRDNSHLTTTYTTTLAPYLLRELRDLGALPG